MGAGWQAWWRKTIEARVLELEEENEKFRQHMVKLDQYLESGNTLGALSDDALRKELNRRGCEYAVWPERHPPLERKPEGWPSGFQILGVLVTADVDTPVGYGQIGTGRVVDWVQVQFEGAVSVDSVQRAINEYRGLRTAEPRQLFISPHDYEVLNMSVASLRRYDSSLLPRISASDYQLWRDDVIAGPAESFQSPGQPATASPPPPSPGSGSAE